MMPFSLELWMAILGSSTFVSIVFFLMDYTSGSDRRFTMKETIWFAIGKHGQAAGWASGPSCLGLISKTEIHAVIIHSLLLLLVSVFVLRKWFYFIWCTC